MAKGGGGLPGGGLSVLPPARNRGLGAIDQSPQATGCLARHPAATREREGEGAGESVHHTRAKGSAKGFRPYSLFLEGGGETGAKILPEKAIWQAGIAVQ